MRVYLVRHGEALSPDQDRKRHLTDKGVRAVEKLAHRLEPLNISVGAIWHSGETRARQTAEILARAVRSWRGISRRKGLRPNAPPEPAKAVLDGLDEDVMIVGHLPFLGRLAGLMLVHTDNQQLDEDDEQTQTFGEKAMKLAARWVGRLHEYCQERLQNHEGPSAPDIVAFRHASVVCLERRLGTNWKIAWMALPDVSPAADDSDLSPSQYVRAKRVQSTEELKREAAHSSRPARRTASSPQRKELVVRPLDEEEARIGQRINPAHTQPERSGAGEQPPQKPIELEPREDEPGADPRAGGGDDAAARSSAWRRRQ